MILIMFFFDDSLPDHEDACIQDKEELSASLENVVHHKRMFIGVEPEKYEGNEVWQCVILLSKPLVWKEFDDILFRGLCDFPLFNLIPLVWTGC